ncbi:hypothetical protein CR513_37671, partial [Mucuna pruriens]
MGHRDLTRRKGIIFTVKHKLDGTIGRYKTRLFSHCFTQTYGVDYQETFAHVAKLNTIRVLLSLVANFDWSLQQYDVKNVFLHNNLSEEIYIACHIDTTSLVIRVWRITIFIIYVDDMIVIGNDIDEMDKLKTYLAFEFDMKDHGGIEVVRSKQGIFMSQQKYDLDLLNKTGTLGCQPIDTPIEQNYGLEELPN